MALAYLCNAIALDHLIGTNAFKWCYGTSDLNNAILLVHLSDALALVDLMMP